MAPQHMHMANAALTTLTAILLLVGISGPTAIWSTSGVPDVPFGQNTLSVNGCGLFNCDGPVVCGCPQLGCKDCDGDNYGDRTCPTVAADSHCEDQAGHMAAAQGFGAVAVCGVLVATLLCILKVIPSTAEKIPYMCVMSMQCIHAVNSILCLVAFALIAATYDMEMCGCSVKDTSSLGYGFVFFVIGFVFQAISVCLVGVAQANEPAPDPLMM